jgi:hypothetical protein
VGARIRSAAIGSFCFLRFQVRDRRTRGSQRLWCQTAPISHALHPAIPIRTGHHRHGRLQLGARDSAPLQAVQLTADTLTGLVGRVTASSGVPLAGVTVVLYSASYNIATRPVRTDRYGRFGIGPILRRLGSTCQTACSSA